MPTSPQNEPDMIIKPMLKDKGYQNSHTNMSQVMHAMSLPRGSSAGGTKKRTKSNSLKNLDRKEF